MFFIPCHLAGSVYVRDADVKICDVGYVAKNDGLRSGEKKRKKEKRRIGDPGKKKNHGLRSGGREWITERGGGRRITD